MDTYRLHGANQHGSHVRRAFTEFIDVHDIQEDFAKKIGAGFDWMAGTNAPIGASHDALVDVK